MSSAPISVPKAHFDLATQLAWEAIKQREIEEKLEKLGVERGSGRSSTLPLPVHAPHARAASVSASGLCQINVFNLVL